MAGKPFAFVACLAPALIGAAPVELPPGPSPEVVLPTGTHESPDEGPGFRDLGNGMSVLMLPRRTPEAVAIQLWLQAGLVDEGPGERGAMAILEAALRLRCERTLLDSPPPVQGAAAHLKVKIDRDATVLAVEGPSRSADLLVRALARAVTDPELKPALVESARALALEEARHQRTQGEKVALAALHGLAFRVHPYRHHLLPSREGIEAREVDEVVGVMRREFVPHGARLVVVGDVDEAGLGRAIVREFAGWNPSPRSDRPKLVEPKLQELRLASTVGPDRLQRLAVGFPAPPFRGEDTPAMAVLAQALDPASGSTVSRILSRSLPPGTTVSTRFVPARDPSLFTLLVEGQDFDHQAAMKAVSRVAESLRNGGLSESDLTLAKERLRTLALFRTQSFAEEARALGLTAILSAPESSLPILERVMGLAPADVARAAQAYLSPSALAAVLLMPRTVTGGPGTAPDAPPTRYELPGGAILVQQAVGAPGVVSASLRLRLSGLYSRPGELACLQERIAAALSQRPGATGWIVETPLPGADRDALAFTLTAPAEDLAPTLTGFLRAFAEIRFDTSGSDLPLAPEPGRDDFPIALDRALDAAVARLLPGTPYGVPRYSRQGLAPPTPDRLRELHRILSTPARMVLAIAGRAEPDELRQTFQVALDAAAASRATSGAGPDDDGEAPREPETPAGAGPAREGDDRLGTGILPGGDSVVVVVAPVAGPGDESSEAADILVRVLAAGPGSRLGRRLRSLKGLGFETGGAYLPLEGGPGLLAAWIGCAPENADLAEMVLREETSRLTLEPVSTDEVMAAREGAASDARHLAQSSSRSAELLARRAHRETPRGRPLAVDVVVVQELARTAFPAARFESFGPALAARRDGEAPD